jgi:hypothetical protein
MFEDSTFNMFWHGDKLSPIDRLCMVSFVNHNHVLRVFTYSDVEMPAGVVVEDAATIMPLDRFFIFQGSPSAFTNIFRYKILLERGGWWVDTDILCLKRKLPDCDYYWANEDFQNINGAVLKFPPGDPMCWRLFRLSEEKSKNLTRWGQLGPDLLTKVLANYTPARLYRSTEDVYPVHWLEAHFVWLPEFLNEVEERIKSSTFLHLWNSISARMGIDKNRKPPLGSFLHKWYDLYHIDVSAESQVDGSRDSVRRFLKQDWVRQNWSGELKQDMQQLYPLKKNLLTRIGTMPFNPSMESLMRIWKIAKNRLPLT